jgi:serine/threonine protein kinase
MARSIAETHGFDTSPIAIADIRLNQWLQTADGRIVLNDFDNSNFMSFNQHEQKYCPHWSGSLGGLLAPEEIPAGEITEFTDVYKFGGILFSILTGLDPYYDDLHHQKEAEVTLKVQQGIPPYLNPRYATRSYIEGRLVQVMERCHAADPSDRPSIFEVVRHLEETQQRYNQEQEHALQQNQEDSGNQQEQQHQQQQDQPQEDQPTEEASTPEQPPQEETPTKQDQ